jgi:hypothetical protein
MSNTHLALDSTDRDRLSAQIGVEPEDVTAEVLLGYIQELREYGHASEAERLIPFLGPYADDADGSPSEAQWREFEVALGIGDGGQHREYEDDSAEAELFETFKPFLGLEDD